jgi:hypothetical protein
MLQCKTNGQRAAQEKRRTTMNTMNASMWMEKFSNTVMNAVLLMGIPAVVIGLIVQALSV